MRVFIIVALILANIVVLATEAAPAGVIQGIVQSGNTPLPGVTVTATNSITNEKARTSTDLNGQYQLKVASVGTYTVEASMAVFAPGIKEADVKDASRPARLDFDLMLASRSQQASAQSRPAVGFRGRGAQRLQVQQTAAPEAEQDASRISQHISLTMCLIQGWHPILRPNPLQCSATQQTRPSETTSILIANKFNSSSISNSACQGEGRAAGSQDKVATAVPLRVMDAVAADVAVLAADAEVLHSGEAAEVLAPPPHAGALPINWRIPGLTQLPIR